MATLASASWADIESARADACALGASNVEVAAQTFTTALYRRFEDVALARLFIALPFKALPPDEAHAASSGEPLPPELLVLCLLGSAGRETSWNDRLKSVAHRAIPLSPATIEKAPMVARLLSDLNPGRPAAPQQDGVTVRLMATRGNGIFHVESAQTAKDLLGRHIIDRGFVERYGIESVFGMAGPYLDGVNVVAIVFSQTRIDRMAADRYGSLINSFKMATARLYTNEKIWAR